MASGLLDKANIILTPTGYKAGTMYNVAPIEQPYEDFVFSRASVASRVNSSGLVEMVGRTLGSNLVQNGDFSEIGPDLVQNGTFDLGSELVSGGNFETQEDVDLWTGYFNAVLTLSEERLLITPSTASSSRATRPITTVVGATYKLVVDFENPDTSTVLIGFTNNANGGGATFVTSTDANGTLILYYTATATTTYISLSRLVSDVKPIYYDNVSVKEVPDWTLTQATVINNTLQLSTTDGSYTAATQSLGSIGESYKIQLDVSNIVGTISVAIGGGTDVDITTNGTHTIYIKSASTTFELKRKFGITNVSASITNVVVQELDPNDYWTLGGAATIENNALHLESATNEYSYARQDISSLAAKTYKIQLEIKNYVSGACQVGFTGSSPNLQNLNVTSDGTYTAYVSPNANGNDLEISREFGGGNFNFDVTNVSVQEVIDTNNIPRINYDSNGENGHWLLEPTSTNLVPYSENLKDGYSTTNSSVDLDDAVSPDGTTTANKFNSTATGSSIFKSNANSSALFHTVSIFLKKGTIDIVTLSVTGGSPAISASTTVNLTSGTITASSGNGSITPTITNYGNDWYRITASSTSNGNVANPTISIVNSSTTASGYFYMWGLQFEGLSYATSYIPTLTGSTVTRATETANGAGSADLINSTEGVLYGEIAVLEGQTNINRYITINNGTDDNFVSVHFRNNANNQIRAIVRVSNSNQCDFTYNPSGSTSFAKFALKWKANDFALWVNGVEIGSDTSGSTFSANTLNNISFDSGQGGDDFYGKVKALAVFNTALTDAELTELTS